MALPQRKATPVAVAVAAPALVNFGDLAMYTGGAYIADGDYLTMYEFVEHQPFDKNNAPKGPKRFGVMVDFYPMANCDEDHKVQQFYSMGSKAIDSFAPNPENGKQMVARPNAPSTNLNDKTNWMEFLRHLMNSGLPAGVLTNDFAAIDGVWVHITNIDEPAERAGFQSNMTSEAGPSEQRKPGKIAVPTAILEGGAPWEGGGGIPAAGSAPAPVAAPKAALPAAKAPAKATPKPAAAPVAAAPAADTEGLAETASAAITTVLTANPNGITRLALRNKTFANINKTSPELANQVITGFFESGDDAALAQILSELGYKIEGTMVKPGE